MFVASSDAIPHLFTSLPPWQGTLSMEKALELFGKTKSPNPAVPQVHFVWLLNADICLSILDEITEFWEILLVFCFYGHFTCWLSYITYSPGAFSCALLQDICVAPILLSVESHFCVQENIDFYLLFFFLAFILLSPWQNDKAFKDRALKLMDSHLDKNDSNQTYN